MSIFLQRFTLFLFVGIFQHSFLDILWPNFVAPAAMIALMVTLVFLSGFEKGGLAALLALILFLLLGQKNELFPLFAVVIVYGTSFLSRRLAIERLLQTTVVLALASAGFALAYILLVIFWTREPVPITSVFANLTQTILVFPIVFVVLKTWEKYVRENTMSEFRGLRT